ncbi:MAG: amidohydrolase family protein [Proteobacteria bacterium]|nr:amidohydrolase family protein [Pseudomonadota bacterium]
MPHDLVVRGGTLIDGTGTPRETGDLAIDGDRIAQVGGRAGAARREIDASGLAVSPGFIDPHTHYDAQISWDPELTPSCYNGVTSVVMGNCGFTVAPCRPDHRERIMRMLERVEGMSLPALQEGISWSWETFPEYLDALAGLRPALNVGAFVGHSAVRYWVMGDAATEREATPEEIDDMRASVREALAAGALGFSTSQAPTHLGGDGRPVPSRYASDTEVVELAGVMAEFGRGAFEIVTKRLLDIEVTIEAARRSGRPATFLGGIRRQDKPLLEKARAEGLRVTPQTSCRPAMNDFRLNEMGLFDQLPSWGQVAQAPKHELPRVFADPEFRAAFRRDVYGEYDGMRLFKGDWDGVSVLVGENEKTRALVGRTVAEIADERGADPLDTFFDLALDDDLRTQFSYCISSDADRGPSLLNDLNLIGLSDAGAHLTLLADHAYTTYFLGRWVRERGLMPLEEAVRKLTWAPAEFFGLPERGLLRPGYHADVVLFDPESVIDRDSELVYDLPGGGPRLFTRCDGIEAVIVNGALTVSAGELTGERAGQVMRGA